MLPHLILIVLQLAGAWWGGQAIKPHIPTLPRFGGYDLDIFVWAILFAVLIFLIGFVGSIVLKGVRTPGAGSLTMALVLALILAALTLVPPVTQLVDSLGLQADRRWWPLLGALAGYFIKR